MTQILGEQSPQRLVFRLLAENPSVLDRINKMNRMPKPVVC
jgi:hypothetical protein